MPNRKLSPVVVRFQTTDTLWFIGWRIVMAPAGAFQHAGAAIPAFVGVEHDGGAFLFGLGISTSDLHISTHRLQPLHISVSKSMARFGVGGLGPSRRRVS